MAFILMRRSGMGRRTTLMLAPLAGGGLMLLLLLSACGGSEATSTPTQPAVTPRPTATPVPTATSTPTPAKAAWEIEWEETVAKAQEEGELVIIGGSAAVYYRPVFQAFQEKFGINVESTTGSTRDLVSRVLAERQAGRYTVDFILGGPTTLVGRLIPSGVLDPAAEAFILPEVKDESLWYQGRHHYADPDRRFIFSHAGSAEAYDGRGNFNTDLVTQEDIDSVSSMWDFLEPRWKGKIVTLRPRQEQSAGQEYFHPDLGAEWLERFYSEMDVLFLDDQKLIVDQVLAGGRALCMPCSRMGRTFDSLARKGGPIGNFKSRWDDWTDTKVLKTDTPAHTLVNINHAANPNAAKVFFNWFLSKEGQTARHTLTASEDEPPPSLRLDVTEWGNTPERERRDPQKDYFILTEAPGYDPEEAGAFRYELYLRTR